jgi:hypothetical protein
MQEFLHLKIVENGARPFLKQALPDQVIYFSTWPTVDGRDAARKFGSLSRLSELWRAVRDPSTSLVVCHPTFFRRGTGGGLCVSYLISAFCIAWLPSHAWRLLKY